MVRDIPQQLRDSRIRFYLIGSNSKIPLEAAWNKTGNYHYDDPKLLRHMGNYGVVCGLGGVIVLDFDDKEYHEGMKHLLPETFVVITAGKQLPHYYYFLEGNEMFKKIGVNNREGKRVCDIQALGSGVVAPGSRYKERFYTPNCIAIQTITLAQLACIFNLNEKQDIEKKSVGEHTGSNNHYHVDTQKREMSIAALSLSGVRIQGMGNMQCPFHAMAGKGNLSILSTGRIYCFHCQKKWWPDEFLAKVKDIHIMEAKQIMDMCRLLYQEYLERKGINHE